MVMLERYMRGLLRNQQAHAWDRDARFQSELRGRRVGIIGYGNIGREVGRVSRCRALELWAMDRIADWAAAQPLRPGLHRRSGRRAATPDLPRSMRWPISCRTSTT